MMSDRPEGIPQWAWDQAFELMDCYCPAIMFGDDHMEPSVLTAISKGILKAREDEREEIIRECEAQKEAFLSPEYAANQPLGSLCERFAIDECIKAIRQHSQKGRDK